MKNIILSTFFLLMVSGIMAQVPGKAVDHEIWDNLLQKHVDEKGNVDYAGFKKDGTQVDLYLSLLKSSHPISSWGMDEQLTYWINAYNVFTVSLILRNYPLKSIRDLKDPWDQKFIKIWENTYSLNDIEHNIIRKKFSEPRIHFALVCAAKSCPPLLNRAYTAEKLDAQLEAQAMNFINNNHNNKISSKEVRLSSLFDWYGSDFIEGDNTLTDYLNKYSNTKIAKNAKISFLEYDWSLNGK